MNFNLHAEVVEEQINTSSVVLTRMVLAHANIFLAPIPSPSLRTDTFKSTNFISTSCPIQTRIRRTVIDIDFASCSSVSLSTIANELVIQINTTFCTNRIARVAQTLVNFSLALKSHKSWSALANKSFQLIRTSSSVLTRLGGTVVNGVLTPLASVTRLAGAGKSVHSVNALSIVLTRFTSTFVNVDFASSTCPSRMTDTLVAKQFVHTHPVEARIS